MPELFEYQKVGRDFLAGREGAMLADQPGVGKTPQAIRAAEAVITPRAKNTPTVNFNICVVTTKASIENWHREFSVWWPGLYNLNNVRVEIINYDVLSTEAHQLKTMFNNVEWDLIIADEAHRLKSPGAKRTFTFYKRVAALRKLTNCAVWLLTGTPAKNHPGELYTHLRSLAPKTLSGQKPGVILNQHQFEERYCRVVDGHFGRRIEGANRGNLQELRGLMSSFMLRRMKADVLKDLPPLLFDVFPLSIKGTDMSPVLGPGLCDLSDDEVLDYIRDQVSSTERRLLGMFKAGAAVEFIEDELDAPGKLIAFAHHRDVLNILESKLGAFLPARVDGNTKDAQAEVDRFQTNPKCRLFLGQIGACGEALNLTRANQVVFVEAAWSPTDNYQAACRAHRYGMGDGLIVRFLSVPDTLDDRMQRILARKASELAELFD